MQPAFLRPVITNGCLAAALFITAVVWFGTEMILSPALYWAGKSLYAPRLHQFHALHAIGAFVWCGTLLLVMKWALGVHMGVKSVAKLLLGVGVALAGASAVTVVGANWIDYYEAGSLVIVALVGASTWVAYAVFFAVRPMLMISRILASYLVGLGGLIALSIVELLLFPGIAFLVP